MAKPTTCTPVGVELTTTPLTTARPGPRDDGRTLSGVRRTASLWAVALAGCFLWSYWPTLTELSAFWSRNPDYSAGQLVPLVAVFLVWRERSFLLAVGARPSLWGLLVLVVAELLRCGAVWYGFGSIERLTSIVAMAGALWLAAGTGVFWRLRWVLAFLLLMLPLPARVHEAVALPLQHLATSLAAMLLELAGFFVVREGHILRLNAQTTIGVTEACSGLRMLTAFVFVSAVLAFVIKRPAWHKTVLIVSSIPIAVLSNAVRSVVTGVFVYYARDPGLSERFHDAAGLAMMPLAVLLSVALLRFLQLLGPASGFAGARAPTQR